MLMKNIINVSVVTMILLVLVGCSNSSTSEEQVIKELEKTIEDSNEMLLESKALESELIGELEKSKVLADVAISETDILKAQNEALNTSLEDSQAKLMALEVVANGDPMPAAVSPYPGMTVLVAATQVLDAMRTDDYVTLASYVDPVNGVYVSPYQYIDFAYTMNLTDNNILNLATIATIFPWGNEPGSGDLISLNMLDYYNEYIYDEDYYLAPIVGMNIVVSSGNMTNNIAASFPTADSVEFLFPQFDPSNGGLDWSSITLVFNTDSGMPMLSGIVHGQWTP